MKRVLNGKRYNTDNATEVGGAGEGFFAPHHEFHAWEATLYQTPRSKVFFLAGEGGALSMWGKPGRDGPQAGHGIIPLTTEQALEWSEQYLDAEVTEEFFADMIADA